MPRSTRRQEPWTLLDRIPSRSDRTEIHEIRLGSDGVTYCTCTAWRMRQGKGSCYHLDQYLLRVQPLKSAGPPTSLTLGAREFRHGSILECNSRGVIFLMKVTGGHSSGTMIEGTQLLDPGSVQISLNAQRVINIVDVVRVVVF